MRTVLLLLVVGLLIAWYFYRQGLDKPEERKERRISPALKNSSRFHAVSVKPGTYACSAANNIAGQRFLASQAPSLPLPDCDADTCECHFVHHNDRRTGKDRRSPFTSGGIAAATGTFSGERRKGDDRRDESEDY